MRFAHRVIPRKWGRYGWKSVRHPEHDGKKAKHVANEPRSTDTIFKVVASPRTHWLPTAWSVSTADTRWFVTTHCLLSGSSNVAPPLSPWQPTPTTIYSVRGSNPDQG